MKYRLTIIGFLLISLQFQDLNAQQWEIAGDNLITRWGKEVTPENAWQEYPRPQLVREDWKNLNGLWSYKIVDKGSRPPKSFDGKILVPYSIESQLSGVKKPLNANQELWYHKQFKLPENWNGKHIKLHFGAVDWNSRLYVNGKKVGEHKGGSDPFSFDITEFLKKGEQKIELAVWDPTDTDIQARGKQTLNPRGFWYTAVSGIWQTVWMEAVHKTSIVELNPVADIDKEKIILNTRLLQASGNEKLKIKIKFKEDIIYDDVVDYSPEIEVPIQDQQLWSPSFPNLYDLDLRVLKNGKETDKVESYFAMRKISTETDGNGFTHLMLNNKKLFQWGTLDQGWWPDGLLTPPSDQAMKYDMEVLKSMGFNMIRKHIKVEPARYYYHADKMGLLLWQDMPSGFLEMGSEQHVNWEDEKDWDRPKASAVQYEKEWKSIIDNFKFFPSIVVWVPFNEGWGQYDTERVVNWTMEYDPTRLVDGVSGWTDRNVGHFYDTHQYPGPGIEPVEQHPGRAMVLGEFGGLGYPIKGHLWDENRRNWGYRTYRSQDELLNAYASLIHNVYSEKARGLVAAIYTQTTDVEFETNGLMTYDREIIKLPVELAQVLHSPLYQDFDKAQWLIRDSELEEQTKVFEKESEAAMEVKGPFSVAKEEQVRSSTRFELPQDKEIENLALKILAWGDVEVFINDVLVLTKDIRTKRHYDDVNLSHYSHLLKEGENVLEINLKASDDYELDYGLFYY